ncbi:MAG: hypothetical protein D9V47_07375 [Clostridia bacterium]|nr:MAG: hypothetical protein D9V47_07375 [Clostridia bacterium]
MRWWVWRWTAAARLLIALVVLLQVPAVARAETQVSPGVQVGMYHLILGETQDHKLTVQENVILDNARTEAISLKEPLRLYLPAGAAGPQVKSSLQTAINNGVVEISGELPPGNSAVAYSYELTSDTPHFDLSRQVGLDVGQIYLFTPGNGGFSIFGDQVADLGLAQVNGQEYHVFATGKVTAGSQVQMLATAGAGGGSSSAPGGPVPESSPKFHNQSHIRFWNQSPFAGINAHLFLAIVIAVPVAILVYYLRSRRRQAPGGAAGTADDEQVFQRLRAREKVLLEHLAELEDKLSRQELDQVEYERLREIYRKKLVEVKLHLRQFAG